LSAVHEAQIIEFLEIVRNLGGMFFMSWISLDQLHEVCY